MTPSSSRRIYLASLREVWSLPAHDGIPARCVFDAPDAAPAPPPLDWALAMPAEPVGVIADVPEPPVPGAVRLGLRTLFDVAEPADYAAAAEAVPVVEWRRTARFCGACAEPLVRDDIERCMVCPRCALRVYPRINPAIITCVTRGTDEVLLARRATPPNEFWSVIAGFVEVGESLEHAVAREVQEEVGITVRAIRYAGSQSWPFPNNLMLGFRSEWADGEVRPDGVEIAEAGWFRRESLPRLPGRVSIARRMVDAWAAEPISSSARP